jgi:hypothetical protein
MGRVQFGGVDVIPPPLDDFFQYDNDNSNNDTFSDASQSMDELMENSLGDSGVDETFGSLDMSALEEIGRDETAREVASDKGFQEAMQDMPKLDSSDVDSSSASDGGMSGFLGVGAGLGLGKVKFFVLNKISSFRNMPEETENVGLDELLDLDDTRNAASIASAESSTRGLFGIANAPVGAQSGA